ncbi:MAG: hypothetical protein ACI9MC_002331 [Kiritimatiellia bacterium]|jgi:hypothetical protein
MGGVFAGIAVPGYLVAISLVAPSSAIAIAIEAVLVPLLANALWKLGLVRGVAQVAGTTFATGLLLWFVVMPAMQLEFLTLI